MEARQKLVLCSVFKTDSLHNQYNNLPDNVPGGLCRVIGSTLTPDGS